MKHWVFSAICAIGIWFGAAACTRSDEVAIKDNDADPPRPVEVVMARRAPFVEAIEAVGVIEGIFEASVISETNGVVESVAFELGDEVIKGQILVRLDDSIEKLQMERARGRYEVSRLELESITSLFESGNSSQAALTRAKADLSGALAEYEQARDLYNNRTIRASIDGLIAARDRRASPGDWLPIGVEVARIVDTNSMKMELAIGEGEIAMIGLGDEVDVFVSSCGSEPLSGSVVAIAAASTAQIGSFPVIVEWPNSCGERAKSGMSAMVHITPQGEEATLIVPFSAIVRIDGVDYLYLAIDGRPIRRAVRIGRIFGNRAEVLKGLTGGEMVIVSSLFIIDSTDNISPLLIENEG